MTDEIKMDTPTTMEEAKKSLGMASVMALTAAMTPSEVPTRPRAKKVNTGFFDTKQWKARKARNKQVKKSRRRNRS